MSVLTNLQINPNSPLSHQQPNFFSSRRIVQCLSLGLLLLTSSSVFAQRYSIYHTTDGFGGRSLNNSNIIAGVNGPSTGHAALDYPHAALNRTLTIDPPRLSSSYLWDINNYGYSVGYFSVFDPGTFSAYPIASMYSFTGERTSLGTTPGMRESIAYGINDWRWVVGQSSNGYPVSESQAFLWAEGHGIFALPCGERQAAAKTVTNTGWIGGSCGRSPYLWANGVGYDISSWLPEYVDLGHGMESRASIAANLYCEVNSIAESHAFSIYCFHQRGTVREHISFVSTPTTRTLTQAPRFVKINAINRYGCAVGFAPSNSDPRTDYVAIKYCDGVLTDLNDVVSSPDILVEAVDINDRGNIPVYSNTRLSLLSPMP